jgi:hypothetical protein
LLRRRYPASTLLRPCPTPARAATPGMTLKPKPRLRGSPPITRSSLPTCRAQYPGGPHGCACRCLPHGCCLPRHRGGSASALNLSRPAQAITRVAAGRIAQPPRAAFVARLRPSQSPSQAARQLPDSSTSIRVEPSSTRETRRQGAPGDTCIFSCFVRFSNYAAVTVFTYYRKSAPARAVSLPIKFDDVIRR